MCDAHNQFQLNAKNDYRVPSTLPCTPTEPYHGCLQSSVPTDLFRTIGVSGQHFCFLH